MATGATPAPGTALTVTGYGKQEGSASAQPSGKLSAASLMALSSDACRSAVGEPNSAVLLCAVSPTAATCQGDSGGPLTEGSPPVEVGIVDVGPEGCPAGQPDGFTNLAAPEVRAFIEGSEAPPVAARPTALPVLRTIGSAPVDYSPLTCEPGAWSGSPSFTYSFEVDNASAQMLQSGPSNVFDPRAASSGLPVVCIVQAEQRRRRDDVPHRHDACRSRADTVRPGASISALKCHLQACTLSFVAFDPNAVALSVRPAALLHGDGQVPEEERGPRRDRKPPVCHATKDAEHVAQMRRSGRLPRRPCRGCPTTRRSRFTVAVANAAGLRPPKTPDRATTLHPPKKKRTSGKH